MVNSVQRSLIHVMSLLSNKKEINGSQSWLSAETSHAWLSFSRDCR